MTPQQFQSNSLQWITAISTVVGPLAALIVAIYAAVQGILHKQQIDNNTTRLNGQSAKIDTLMLATPPPGMPTVTATANADGSTTATAGDSPPAQVVATNAAPLP